ncbi:MAG: DUF4153 domain-containing protein [Culicoidibacterales bacterium]
MIAQTNKQVVINKTKFSPDKVDVYLAISLSFFSYFFIKWISGFSWMGPKVSFYILAYVGLLLVYTQYKKIQRPKESFYWLTILLLCALSYGLFGLHAMSAWQFILTIMTAIYWTASVMGGLLRQKTTNVLIVDICNILFVVPFSNLRALVDIITIKRSNEKQMLKGQVISIVIAILILIPLVSIILPALTGADSSNLFTQIMETIFKENIISDYIRPGQLLFSILLLFYWVALILGFGSKRNTTKINLEAKVESLKKLKGLSRTTISLVLLVIISVYFLFIVTQIPYLFSAFIGKIPLETESYAEYARHGFFELCWIVTFNLAILLSANLFSRSLRVDAKWLRYFNIVLAIITMLLITTAYSKMGLYISHYGLTVNRIKVCATLLFLLLTWSGIIVLQFRVFSIVRFSLMCGSAILIGLCLLNLPLNSL